MAYSPTYDAAAYFKQIAESLKDIANSSAGNHYTKVTSLRQMEGFLAERQSLTGVQLVYMDVTRGRMIDHKSDNLILQRFHTFFVFAQAPDKIYDSKGVEVGRCMGIATKIISKMRYDRMNYLNFMDRLDINSISIDQVGPIGQGWHGVNVSFMLLDNPGNISYNATDWIS